MTPVDALYLLAGCTLTLTFLIVGILGRWIVPGWAFRDKNLACEGWKNQCDTSTRLASQATTIAEQLARATLHIPNSNSAT